MSTTIPPKPLALQVPRLLEMAAAAGLLLSALPQTCPAAQPTPASAILQDLHDFEATGRVLYVAAHPDDENTQLIAYLAGGRHYRTAYLSLTRGDGGQNVLGPEFGDELGVIRTQELLAARRIDGGQQFFSRAIDFGFSKDYQETLRIWNRQEVLSDIVRVIREFRPDVLIMRFSLRAGRTHGHHTASAVLALEAFKLAGDPQAFPEQLKELTPWQPKRIFWNAGGFQRSDSDEAKALRINVGGDDAATGESFADIAAHSRSMHKTQGFGGFRGGRGDGPRWESFELLGGEPATKDILDGVDTTWKRFPDGAEIGQMAADVIAKFDPENPAASVPDLLKLKARLARLHLDPVLKEKGRLLDHILQQCLGLKAETTVPRAEVLAGETLSLRHVVAVQSKSVPVRWEAARYPSLHTELAVGVALSPGQAVTRDSAQTLPSGTPLTQPYWLREDRADPGTFRVSNPELIGRPENPPVLPVELVFTVGDQTLVVPDEPVQVAGNSEEHSARRLEVISPVSLHFASETGIFPPAASREVTVEVTATRPNQKGDLRLKAPTGWKVGPAQRTFDLSEAGAHQSLTFTITAPQQPTTGIIAAQAEVNGQTYNNDRVVIDYPHIPIQLLQPTARLRAVCLDLMIRGRSVGYLPGAGDNVADALKAIGYSVTTLSGADLIRERLKDFDAVVIGVRAFNVRDDLADKMDALFAYVEAGGNLIEQYNRPNRLKTQRLAPFELHLSSERVSDETAPVTFLAPDHPALTTPNKITSADFEGWIQERGIYYPDRWDDHFTPILACHDPGEQPLEGGLLVAPYGKGHVVYTGLVFFRELPAGVPGAYRLFANLVSLGK